MLDWFSRRKAAKRSPAKQADCIVDQFLESYGHWREACEEVRCAYELWHKCTPRHRTAGYETYLAALDREELAARVHSHQAQELRAAGAEEQPMAAAPLSLTASENVATRETTS